MKTLKTYLLGAMLCAVHLTTLAESFMFEVPPPDQFGIQGYTVDYGRDYNHLTNRMVFPLALQPIVNGPNYGLFVSGLTPSVLYYIQLRQYTTLEESDPSGLYEFTPETGKFWETVQVSYKSQSSYATISQSTNLVNWGNTFDLPPVYSNFISGYPLKDAARYFKGATNMTVKLYAPPAPVDHGTVGYSEGEGMYGWPTTKITNSETGSVWFTNPVGATNAVLTDYNVGPGKPGSTNNAYRPVFAALRKIDGQIWWGTNGISWPTSGTNQYKILLYPNEGTGLTTNDLATVWIDWRY